MKTLIVGGDFGDTPKQSSILKKISSYFGQPCINGGKISDLPNTITTDLAIWMPNISNEEEKHYPVKNTGCVLFVSKVMREGYTDVDAVERIFKMHGNAVIAIYKETDLVRFRLLDSLGNEWYNGTDIGELCNKICNFYEFTKNAIRCKSTQIQTERPTPNPDITEFIDINKQLSDFIQTSCGERFFGNLSTRCSKLFPTSRYTDISMFVSPRNIDKSHITINDMVYCENNENGISYVGDKKPSVDSPIQLKVYKKCKDVNYMIHGHAFIEDDDKATETKQYYLCGDLREAGDVIRIIETRKKLAKLDYGAINLKKHGFLLYADTLTNLQNLIMDLTFTYTKKEYVRYL
jgi:hypothetical protein